MLRAASRLGLGRASAAGSTALPGPWPLILGVSVLERVHQGNTCGDLTRSFWKRSSLERTAHGHTWQDEFQ